MVAVEPRLLLALLLLLLLPKLQRLPILFNPTVPLLAIKAGRLKILFQIHLLLLPRLLLLKLAIPPATA